VTVRYLHFVAESDAQVLAALNRLWAEIRAEHQDVPEVVLDITPGRSSSCTSVGWLEVPVIELNLKDGDRTLTGREVLSYYLHQAAHGLTGPEVRGSEGRYHSRRFREAARQLGLDVGEYGGTGWSETELARGTLTRYQPELRPLDRALRSWRPTVQPKATRSSRNLVAAVCSCIPARRIRVSAKTLAAAPITCGACGQRFMPPR
jgi:hypothetical protein